jgi:hypothetical protein
MHMLER